MEQVLYYSRRFLQKHGTTILSCLSAAGVVGSMVMTAKATPKAIKLLDEAKQQKEEELTPIETIKIVAPVYAPAVAVGSATIACIIGSSILNKRQQLAMGGAYALVDRAYKEYKEKLRQLYGDDHDHAIREELARDAYDRNPIAVREEKQLFYDDFSMRYFESTIEDVQNAEYHFNRNFILKGYACLNDLYDFLEIPKTDYGSELGWSLEAGGAFYGYSWVDFVHEKVTMMDGLECYIITMPFEPTADYLGNYDDF